MGSFVINMFWIVFRVFFVQVSLLELGEGVDKSIQSHTYTTSTNTVYPPGVQQRARLHEPGLAGREGPDGLRHTISVGHWT